MANPTINKSDTITVVLTGQVTHLRPGYTHDIEFRDQDNRTRTIASDSAAILTVTRALPKITGAVIRITTWASISRNSQWVATRHINGRWLIAVDTAVEDGASVTYSDAYFTHEVNAGSMDFEVLYTPEG